MARTFNGTSDKITITRTSTLEPAFPLAVGMWVKGTSPGNFDYLVSKLRLTGEHPSYGISTNGSGEARFIIGWGGNSGEFVISPTSAAPYDGAWHHVLGAYDGAAVRLFVDGSEIGSGTAETRAVSYSTDGLWLGSFDGTQLFGAITMADVALWAAVPSAAERAALAKGVPASRIRRDALRAYWPLYGVASPEADLSGSAQNGTVTGATAAAHAPVGPYVSLPPAAGPAAVTGASVNAAVSLTATAGITAAATVTRPAAATLAATGGITATAVADRPAATTLTASAGITAAAGVTLGGVAAVAATATITAAATADRLAAATLTATATISAVPEPDAATAGLDIAGVLDAIVSHALALGLFDQVNGHEPRSMPGLGLSAAVWMQAIAPVQSSGLDSTSGRLEFTVRLYQPLTAQPLDAVDPALLDAVSQLLAAYSGDFDLGETVRHVDLLGAAGTPLSARAGYLQQDGQLLRVMDITLPCVINDIWTQEP